MTSLREVGNALSARIITSKAEKSAIDAKNLKMMKIVKENPNTCH